MTFRQACISWGILAATVAVGFALTAAEDESGNTRSVAQLLPGNTVILVGQDGSAAHKVSWEKTAAYEAMYKSGMVDAVGKVFDWIGEQSGAGQNPQVEELLTDLDANGASVAISMPDAQGPPIPRITVVLRDAAKHEAMLSGMSRGLAGLARVQFEQRDVKGRTVASGVIPDSPSIEIGLWAEGNHLMIVAGIDAVNRAVSVVDGDAPNLTTNAVWKKYNYNVEGFEATSVVWLDFKTLRNKFGQMPLPMPGNKVIHDVLKTAGLHNLDTLAYQYGYKGRALWSEGHVDIDGERTGLLALTDYESMTLADLPPLPAGASAFSATRVDASLLGNVITKMVRDGSTFGPPDASEHVDQVITNLPQILGFDPQKDLFDSFGNVACIYSDANQGLMGTGAGAMIKVKDPALLKATVKTIVQRIEKEARGDFRVHRSTKQGRELLLFQFGPVQAGALAIDDNWLVVGLMPQTVEAALMRLDGNLETWQPSIEQATAMAELPASFTSITIGDPRVSWQSLIQMAPVIMSAGQVALKEERIIPRDVEFPITVADLPPAELVARPLFPNVSVTTSDEHGVRVVSRNSLPGIPLIGGIGEVNGVATTGILVALLLPAVQQARTAARRTQSRNHLKQIALSLHNYHDAYGHFPSGTHPNEKLKPDERISWLTTVLPFVEQQPLFSQVDFDESWDDDANTKLAEVRVPVYLNPGSVASPVGPAETHYVGICGVGADAPMLPANSKRAGIFGVNRQTRIRDITDGTSNTLMTSEASGDFGPWMSGGTATMRSFTKQPYINGPDGIGGPYPGGCNVGLADGSVRFVSENIDPKVLEALATMAGGEVIGAF